MIHSIGNASSVQHIISGAVAEVSSFINVPSTILLLISTALVLLMVPCLGIFYGGLERRKNVSMIITQSIISIPIVTLIWIFGGFGLAFGTDLGGIIGNPADYFAFRNILFGSDWTHLGIVSNATIANGVPFIVFFLFQLSFAIITPALVSGAFADRLRLKGYIAFTILFTIFIYIPVCHWIWGGGWLSKFGAIDWAGGTVIHITCGMAAISAVIVLKKRQILNIETTEPHSLPLVAIGAALLFFGWFGFNTGGATYTTFTGTFDELQQALTNGTLLNHGPEQLWIVINSFVNSFIGMSAAMILWTIIDVFRKKRTSLLSILTAGIAGLATITPAAGFVPIWGSLVIGLIGGGICYLMCILNHKARFDDALEVWPVHGVAGLVGSIVVSAFATQLVNPILLSSTQGLTDLHQIGSAHLLLWQFIMIIVVCAWTFVFAIGIFYFVILIKGKTTIQEQIDGLDKTLLGEQSYSKGIKKDLVNNQSQQSQINIVTNNTISTRNKKSSKKVTKKS